ncbi:ATP-dependent DNA helicase RecG [Longibacter salinarum]|uniref:ATP-dependent DNA helicase RecG n=1 Tax=Longibacter salinarum TaxID=1850348 RepID=A0A2A8CXI5_9BACT|nr:ATP-dependent DNA helicase RecG [Longibacter salinarum]PEN13098.1 ATP-dependent DNA helicase RecG [Longibacter salinarum]
MSDDFLQESVRYLKGVGERRAEVWDDQFGVRTVRDLLHFYPRRYLDRSTITPVGQLRESSDPVTVVGTVRAKDIVPGKRSKRFELILEGERGAKMKCTWFQGIWFIPKVFEVGERVAFHGKVQKYGRWFSMTHPDYDKLEGESALLDTGRIVALYPGSEAMDKVGLNSRSIRRVVYNLFKEHGLKLEEPLPDWMTDRFELMEGRVALRAIHFPKSQSELSRARTRLKFEELFYIQLLLADMRQSRSEIAGPMFDEPGDYTRQFVREVLPFELTGAQKRALKDVIADTQTGTQMNRLVQGDVGSGKTVVAVAAMMHALDSGYQSAFMAPTEILAEQHYTNLRKYLNPLGIEPRLLIGSQSKSEREEALRAVRSADAPVAVGTHALIQEEVQFDRLGLAIVDEQHRFGVAQRATIFDKGDRPHMLLMTATPIPRSLAMTLYGDLDVSIMDEMPAGRKPVKTVLRAEKRRGEVYAFVQDQLEKGQQAYVVYPLVEESEKVDLKDAVSGYEKLQKQFSNHTVGLVHGQMKSDEKDATMRRFKNGEIDLLVSTTVIEVGVDVANATLMIIEHAERFGLSQLHQLRGRVGRSDIQSYCILMAGYKRSAEAKERLQAMVDTNDGFEISERDLQIRGAGDFFGTRQSGLPDLKIADITEDEDLIEEAREGAQELVERDPELDAPEHSRIRDRYDAEYRPRQDSFARVG